MTSPTADERPARPPLWRQSAFRNLWIAETISQFGTQISLIALPVVAVLVLGATPFEVALLGTIEFLPFLLFTLPAGAWVDRLRRRPILILGDLGRAISLASIPVAYVLGVLGMPQLFVVGFVNGVLTVFFDVAYQSYLPALVERDELADGNGKLEISRASAQIAGPTLGGATVAVASAPTAIALDAVSFVASALFVLGIRKREPAPERPVAADGRHPSLRSEVAAGLRYVLGHPHLRAIAASTGTSNLATNTAFATLPIFLYRELALDPAVVGVIFGVGNAGALLAAFTASRIARRFGVGPTIVGSIAIGFPSLLLVPLAPTTPPWLWIALAVSVALGGFSAVVYNVNQVSYRQAITPDAMQGRMNATMRFIVWGTIPIGQILGGAIATATDVRTAIWVGVVLSAFAVLPVALSPVRRLRAMPVPMGSPAPAAAEASAAGTSPGAAATGGVATAADERDTTPTDPSRP